MSTCTASECYRESTGSGKARLAAIPAAEAKKAGKAEGKIKETGTPRRRFLGKPLSAHCFRGADMALCFPGRGAALCGKSLSLRYSLRHCAPFFARKRPLIPGRLHEWR
jgi:hypothetical protein